MEWADRVGRRVKLRDLHVILAVAQWGSMAKAARHLSTSQPVLSKTVAELERSLGVKLFDRSPQGVEPTMYGRALLNRSLAVFDELREGIKEIEFLADPAAGELRIGCPESMTVGLLPAVAERLARTHPQIVLHVVQANTVTLEFRELRDRSVDLMLGRISRPFDPDLNIDVLYEEEMFVVVGAESEWARRRKITLADLADAPWVNAPADSGRLVPGQGVPRPRPADAEGEGGLVFDLPSQQPAGEGAPCRAGARLGAALQRQELCAQGSADPAAGPRRAGRRRHSEEPHAQSGGEAVRGLRPRGHARGEQTLTASCNRWSCGGEHRRAATTEVYRFLPIFRHRRGALVT